MAEKSKGLFSAEEWQCKRVVLYDYTFAEIIVIPLYFLLFTLKNTKKETYSQTSLQG